MEFNPAHSWAVIYNQMWNLSISPEGTVSNSHKEVIIMETAMLGMVVDCL